MLGKMPVHSEKARLEVFDRAWSKTSQLEPKDWRAVIGNGTLADAILDRMVHNAHRLRLAGESIRKADANSTKGRKQAK